MLPQCERVGPDGEAEEEERSGAEGEHRDDLQTAPPGEQQVLTQRGDEAVHAPSASPERPPSAAPGISEAGPEKMSLPLSRTRAREQIAWPRRNRWVDMRTVLRSARRRSRMPSTRRKPGGSRSPYGSSRRTTRASCCNTRARASRLRMPAEK